MIQFFHLLQQLVEVEVFRAAVQWHMFPAQAALVGEVLPETTLARTQVARELQAKATLVVALMAFLATIPLVAVAVLEVLGNLRQASPILLAAQAALVWQAA